MSTETEVVLEEIAKPVLSTVVSPLTPSDRLIKCQDVVIPTGNQSVSRHIDPNHHAPITNDRPEAIPFDAAWVMRQHINKSGVDQRASEIGTRRSVKKQWQAAWLLKAITSIDLTTLAGDDTTSNVRRLCAKAKNPVRQDILEMLGAEDLNITCGAVCVYPARVKDAVEALKGTGIPVAAVATGFPSGQIKHEHKLEEIKQAVADGASEIDIVINRQAALIGDWQTVYNEVKDFREACGDAHMKSILAVGDLATYTNVHRASLTCMMAGSDFIKTSTGKEAYNATLPVSLVMVRAIREYLQATGYKIGFKPAGGVSAAKTAVQYQCLMKEELGNEWVQNDLFRIGASSLLTDIERQLYHQATNEYAADYYMPMA
jgi:deoxyribose-phosphate aldolase